MRLRDQTADMRVDWGHWVVISLVGLAFLLT
jgi:hypothetical protein